MEFMEIFFDKFSNLSHGVFVAFFVLWRHKVIGVFNFKDIKLQVCLRCINWELGKIEYICAKIINP